MAQATYAVVIVTYNRKDLLHECVHQVKAQLVPAARVVIVDNASTDGTSEYLKELSENWSICQVINCPVNTGGAGGFARGIACAAAYDTDCMLLIDDDAMLADDYMQKLLQARKEYPDYSAFAGIVMTDGNIDPWHRRMLSRAGLLFKNCPASLYRKSSFVCDIVSFCGMLVDTNVIKEIGLPHADYFIWNDDAEYSLRIRRYSRFLVISDAVLNHKTKVPTTHSRPRRYEWRDYYAVRNRLLLVQEHGTLLDKIINYTHLLIHTVFRNWLFGAVRRDHYDWLYEKRLTKKAILDAAAFDHKSDQAMG